MSSQTNCVKSNALTISLAISVVSSVILGCVIRANTSKWSEREIAYLAFPGQIFLNLMTMLMVPMLISCIVNAIASIDLSLSKKIARRAIFYFVATIYCGSLMGVIVGIVMRPGVGTQAPLNVHNVVLTNDALITDRFMDLARNMFPPNLMQAMLEQHRTVVHGPDDTPKGTYTGRTNLLGLVVFSVVLGVSVGLMGKSGQPLINFFNATSKIIMEIIGIFVRFTPVGILFLIVAKLVEADSVGELVSKLGWFCASVLVALALHVCVTLSGVFFFFTATLPFKCLFKAREAFATAFGASSSTAAMPVTLRCAEKMDLSRGVVNFVIPIGTMINLNGTALYQAIAPIFMAQVRGKHLNLADLFAVSITSSFASIGGAGVPSGSLITMVMVLDTIGVPAQDVAMIYAVDWLLDRFRTTTNVMSNVIGATLVDHLSRKEIRQVEERRSSAI